MREEIREKVTMYRAVNELALRGEIAVFGSSFMANFPFYELSQKYVLSSAVYNRSIENLTLPEAEEALADCVLSIKPSKIFLSLGEKDEYTGEAIETYHRIIRKIQNKLPEAKIFILPLQEGETEQAFNEALRKLAEHTGATFLSIPSTPLKKSLYERIFKTLHRFFRNKALSLTEAFSCAD